MPDVAHVATPGDALGGATPSSAARQAAATASHQLAGSCSWRPASRRLRSGCAPRPTTVPSAATASARALPVPTSSPTQTGGRRSQPLRAERLGRRAVASPASPAA